MLGRELLVALTHGQRLGGLDETAGAVRIFLEIHVVSLGLSLCPGRRRCGIVNGLTPAVPDLGQTTAEDRWARTPNGGPLANMWELATGGGRACAAIFKRS